MKYTVLLILSITGYMVTFGQKTKRLNWRNYTDTTDNFIKNNELKSRINTILAVSRPEYPDTLSVRTLSQKVFYKIVSKDFTRIAGGGLDPTGTSSYAFADIARPSVSLGAAFAFKAHNRKYMGHFISLSAKGGINENTTQLFANDKFSATFGGQILFSHLLYFDVRLEDPDIIFPKSVDSIVARNILMIDSLQLKISLEETKLEAILYAIQTGDTLAFKDLYPPPYIAKRMEIYRQRLRILNDETIARLESLRKRKESISNTDYKGKVIETYPRLKRAYAWISHGVAANNTEFRLYNPNEVPLLNNISKTSFLSWNLPVRINYLSENNISNGDNFYLFGEVSIGRSDNLSSLSKFNYRRDHTIKDVDTSKSVNESFEVYRNKGAGEYKQFHYLKFAYSHLHFLTKQRIVGITGYFSESSRFHTHDTPIHGILDLGMGIFISVPNRKKGEAAVNMELYTRFFDVLNRNNIRNSKFYDRNLVAIRIGIPFQITASPH